MTPFLAALLLLGQALDFQPSIPNARPDMTRARARTTPHPVPAKPFRITIVNATSFTSISLSTKGSQFPAEYPFFPQGSWIECAPRTERTLCIHVTDQDGTIATDRQLSLPAARQFLLITRETARNGLSESTPIPTPGVGGEDASFPPDIRFRSYPVELVVKDHCHYRVINAMPGKTLLLCAPARDGQPRRLLGVLTPGSSLLLKGQPPAVDWLAVVDGKEIVLPIAQEGAVGNCLVPFFLRDGRPSFIRVFETP